MSQKFRVQFGNFEFSNFVITDLDLFLICFFFFWFLAIRSKIIKEKNEERIKNH